MGSNPFYCTCGMTHMATVQKIAPCLCFDGQAEEAAKFYTSIFPNSRITSVSYYGEAGPLPKGSVMVVMFQMKKIDIASLKKAYAS